MTPVFQPLILTVNKYSISVSETLGYGISDSNSTTACSSLPSLELPGADTVVPDTRDMLDFIVLELDVFFSQVFFALMALAAVDFLFLILSAATSGSLGVTGE
ncbi:hypothetical protein RRG08_063519 [Elysia crispata]|uniref:Uncharacterized protein n=1 Tax=Elysia crispata TaxID=231223 RepID=A0AAE1E9K7_9GAST|nr:hypothetical protein RRG08_063519 [Elysia crispata]